MKLIDAEHLIRWILARWEKTDPRSAYPLRAIDIIDQIDREDTIEAEPIIHGKWLFNGYQTKCSVCEDVIELEDGQRWNSPYCPSCGAKMDEVNDD